MFGPRTATARASLLGLYRNLHRTCHFLLPIVISSDWVSIQAMASKGYKQGNSTGDARATPFNALFACYSNAFASEALEILQMFLAERVLRCYDHHCISP
ncbi:hypothetical protein LMH87_004275 [Akanthomyces muscarius]|uniref:Uncharacterized protein n=1 Tax=Akanthomyces muscarius TaxID=2231603 RepID=A0A9W8UHH3_AKAMU|nr:hypothetical protein LMH87_004275 [Akanthomyces muscarius]KAJ4145423.1 hypothetical protein LMH87_004275 [Akanthomyces muscarius]